MQVRSRHTIQGVSVEPHGQVIVTAADGRLMLTPGGLKLSGPGVTQMFNALYWQLHRFEGAEVRKSLIINPEDHTLNLAANSNRRELFRHRLGGLEDSTASDPAFQKVIEDANIALC